MIQQVGRLAKQTGIYGLGVVASRSVGFLLIPVYSRFLSPKDYGALELLDLIIFFSGMFAVLGIYNAVFRFYSAYDSEQDKKEVISSALLFNAGMSALVSVGIIFAAPTLALAVLGSSSYSHLVRIVALTLFFSNMAEVPLAYFRAKERVTLFVSIGLGRTLLGMSLLVLFIAGFRMGVKGAVYANLIANAIGGTILFLAVLTRVPLRIVGPKLREMLRYGAPLIVQNLASFALVFSDRFFLRRYGNLTEVGLYSLGYKLAGMVDILVSGPFNMAWQWQQFELAKQEDAPHLYAKILSYQLLVAVFVGLGLSLLAHDALRIMCPQEYWAASSVVPLIALSYILANARAVILSGMFVRKLTHHVAAIAIPVAGLTLLFNYVLIPKYLRMGAAVATVLAYLVSLMLCYVMAQRVYRVVYEYRRSAIILATAGALYLASTRIHLQLIPSVLANLALLGVYGLMTFAILDRGERAMFHLLARKAVQRLIPGFLPPEPIEALASEVQK